MANAPRHVALPTTSRRQHESVVALFHFGVVASFLVRLNRLSPKLCRAEPLSWTLIHEASLRSLLARHTSVIVAAREHARGVQTDQHPFRPEPQACTLLRHVSA